MVFRVAQLPHHDHVGVLAQHVLQPLLEAREMGVELPLVHQRLVREEAVFDGVFQGDDVGRAGLVISRIMAAMVVDLPLPVGPQMRIKPWCREHSSRSDGWILRTRSPAPATAGSARPGPGRRGVEGVEAHLRVLEVGGEVHGPALGQLAALALGGDARMSSSMSAASKMISRWKCNWPFLRTATGWPVRMCRSVMPFDAGADESGEFSMGVLVT